MQVEGFDWDTGNIEKNLLKHGITCVQIEKVFHNSPWIAPDITHSLTEERFLAIGQIGTRYIFVVFAFRINGHRTLIRPISARFMHKKEIKRYEEEIKKNNDR